MKYSRVNRDAKKIISYSYKHSLRGCVVSALPDKTMVLILDGKSLHVAHA